MPLHTTIYARSPQGCAGKVILVRHHEKSIRKQHVLAHPELQHTLTEQAVVKRTAREVNDPSVHLATQLSRRGYFGRERDRFYAANMVEGVEGLHRAGVIYREFATSNHRMSLLA
ncbi:unnamed protein product [Tilletia controversa]|uniref:Non-specific serine/threonine protein kinase n=1 Tax=Tilletia controversa TaxID=13291 RepID=A0A8X7SYY8_9BASI|nr:hypothetical protein A4X06_0g2601 [Tilletia controversa]CAD6980925.1 unnamed protein product [Tilletia controversa]